MKNAKLERIAELYRVPVKRDSCGDPVIAGRNGHVYVDAGRIMVCFTDDGRPKPFPTARFKNMRLKMLPGIRLTQEGDYEFIGEIPESLVRTALFKVLRVKRFQATKGVSFMPKSPIQANLAKRNLAPSPESAAAVQEGMLQR